MIALAILVTFTLAQGQAPGLPAAGATVVAAVEPRDVADKWIAIAHSLAQGAPAPVMPAVEGASWQRFKSLSLKNLMPCYDVIIGGAFADKKAALALVKKMRDAGINAYAKQSGKFVGEPPALVAHCARVKEVGKDGDGACGSLSFVEEHGKRRLFARVDVTIDDATWGKAGKQKPVDDDKKAWAASLPDSAKAGPWTKGYAVDVYDVANGKAVGACKVERLVSLTRGEPHFGYFQSDEPPKGPGCGEPDLFAELSCTASSAPSDVFLALPAGHRPPKLFVPTSTPVSLDDAAKKALIAHVMTMQASKIVKAQAESDAASQKLTIDEAIEARRFTAEGGRSVLGVMLTWSTGEANPCSGDVIRTVMAVVDEKAGGKLSTAVPAWETQSMLGVRAVYDIEGDGKLEVVERDLSTTLIRRSDGSELCSDVIPFCDCGC